MVLWITGNSGAGKSTLAKFLCDLIPNSVHIDGDVVREADNNFNMSRTARVAHNLKVAHHIKTIKERDISVVVSIICPYKDLRKKVHEICGCDFIYIAGGETGKNFPYEIPNSSEAYVKYKIKRN